MDALVKGLLQGSIPTIVLVGGTHYLVKGFKVSRPVVYWGSLAVAAGLTYAVVEGKIKVPFMNAETFGAESEKEELERLRRIVANLPDSICRCCGDSKWTGDGIDFMCVFCEEMKECDFCNEDEMDAETFGAENQDMMCCGDYMEFHDDYFYCPVCETTIETNEFDAETFGADSYQDNTHFVLIHGEQDGKTVAKGHQLGITEKDGFTPNTITTFDYNPKSGLSTSNLINFDEKIETIDPNFVNRHHRNQRMRRKPSI